MNLSMRLRWLLILTLPMLAFAAHSANLSPGSLTLLPGESGIITVKNAKGTPSLANPDAGVVSATLTGNKIKVTALTAGSATLSLTDSSGIRTASVTVKPPMSVSPASVSLLVGQTATVTISDATGKIKLKNSGKEFAKTGLAKNLITVTGKRQGRVNLTVSDRKTHVTVQVDVLPPSPPPTTGGSSSGRLLASNCFQCHGTNGSGGFDRLRGSNELLQELREFASGKEDAGGIMAAHSMGYTDAQLKAIADYLSNQ